jgi:hypothetical protein
MADEMKIKKRFEEDLATSKKYMDPIHQQMDKYYEMYRNRWVPDDDQMMVSDLYAYAETVVPILTNNRPRSMVKAEDPEYIKHAEGMEYILDSVFDDNDWDYLQQRIVRMAEIYRSGLAYTGYDETAEHNTGKITIQSINPRWCYFDPASLDLEDSSFFMYIEPLRASKVKAMYPDKAEEIGKEREGTYGEKDKGWFKSLLNTVKGYLAGIGRDGNETLPELSEEEKRKNAVAFIHYWYRDDDDKWRVAYFADDLFLEDNENPFWHEKLPYDIFSPTEDILSVFGIPMAEHIEDISHEKNVLLHMFVKSAKKAVDPPLIYNTTVGIDDPRQLRRRAEEDNVIPVANPEYIPLNAIAEYMNVPGVPNWAKDIPHEFMGIQDSITGINDSFRGMSEATSGKEVQLKQEAAYTRIKTKVDNFEKFVKSIAKKIIVNAMQFIDTDTQFRVQGDYSKYEEEDAPFQVEPIPVGKNEEGQTEYDKNEFFLYANPHEWIKIVKDPENEEETTQEEAEEAYHILNMVVDIEAGSSLPQSRSAKREEALELFNAGAIDHQALLEAFEYPDYEEILKRINEQVAQEKEAEMMANVPPVPQGQPIQQAPIQQQPMAQAPQQAPDLSVILDQLRQMDPRLAQMSDEQLLQVLQNMPIGEQQQLQQAVPQQAPQQF